MKKFFEKVGFGQVFCYFLTLVMTILSVFAVAVSVYGRIQGDANLAAIIGVILGLVGVLVGSTLATNTLNEIKEALREE